MNWIDVDLELPPLDVDVQIKNETFQGVGFYSTHGWCCVRNGVEEYFDDVVTHWRDIE